MPDRTLALLWMKATGSPSSRSGIAEASTSLRSARFREGSTVGGFRTALTLAGTAVAPCRSALETFRCASSRLRSALAARFPTSSSLRSGWHGARTAPPRRRSSPQCYIRAPRLLRTAPSHCSSVPSRCMQSYTRTRRLDNRHCIRWVLGKRLGGSSGSVSAPVCRRTFPRILSGSGHGSFLEGVVQWRS